MAVLLSAAPTSHSRPDVKSSPLIHSPAKPEAPPFDRYIFAPHTILQALFYALLFTIPLSMNTPVFMPVILAVRLLLFAPLYLPSAQTPSYKSSMAVAIPFVASRIAFLTEIGPEALLQGIKEDPGWCLGVSPAAIKTVLSAVNGNHAVQALGWDAVISAGSGLVWYMVA